MPDFIPSPDAEFDEWLAALPVGLFLEYLGRLGQSLVKTLLFQETQCEMLLEVRFIWIEPDGAPQHILGGLPRLTGHQVLRYLIVVVTQEWGGTQRILAPLLAGFVRRRILARAGHPRLPPLCGFLIARVSGCGALFKNLRV